MDKKAGLNVQCKQFCIYREEKETLSFREHYGKTPEVWSNAKSMQNGNDYSRLEEA